MVFGYGEEKRFFKETFVYSEKRRDEQIANGEDFDEDAYTNQNQKLVQK